MPSNPTTENPESAADPDGHSPPTLTPDELLPPVEPPDARFIVQLFVVPAVIVAAVFLLVATINWFIAQKEDPTAKVKALESANLASWQHAYELAQMLQDESRYPELRQNTTLAGHLAQLLSQGVEEQNEDDGAAEMRYFLCRTLGRFHVDDGLEALLTAARQDVDLGVRRAAVNAIAELGISLSALESPQELSSAELIDALVSLAVDQNELIRSETAFAIGVIMSPGSANPRLTQQLENLLEDVYCDARYNAALALARQGNLLASETIVEMLDADQLTFSMEAEKTPASQAYKRNTLFRNALFSARTLLEKNPQLDQPSLVAAVRRFVDRSPQWDKLASVPKPLIKQAEKLLADFAYSR